MDYRVICIILVGLSQDCQVVAMSTVTDIKAKYISVGAVRATWRLPGGEAEGQGAEGGGAEGVSGYRATLSPTHTCTNLPSRRVPAQHTSITFRDIVPGKLYTFCIQVELENGNKTEWTSVKVSGKAHIPATLTRTPSRSSMTFTLHERINETCEASGTPKPQINWYKGNTIVSESGVLYIPDLSSKDQGTYVCVAWNSEESKALSPSLTLEEAVLDNFHPNDRRPTPINIRGEEKRLECRAPKSYPLPQVRWVKLTKANDPSPQPVQLDERVMQASDNSLLFVYTVASDAGLYQCEVTNHILETSVSGSAFQLIFSDTDPPPAYDRPKLFFPLPLPPSVLSKTGQTVRIDCVFSGRSVPETTWYMEGTMLKKDKRYSFGPAKHWLQIDNVNKEDEGKYECDAGDTQGKRRNNFKLIVHEKPHWIMEPQSYNATYGENVTFECLADGIPTPEIQWLINDQPRTEENLLSWQQLSDDHTRFTLINVTKDYIMNFQCKASNLDGQIMKDLYMNVLLPTKIVRRPQNALLGTLQKFVCEAETDPATPLRIRWLKGGKELDPEHPGVYVDQDWSLVINLTDAAVKERDYLDSYTCEASNGHTKDIATASLNEHLPSVDESQTQQGLGRPLSTGTMLWVSFAGGVGLLVVIFVVVGIVRRRKSLRPRSDTMTSIITVNSQLSRHDSDTERGAHRPLISGGESSVCYVGDDNLKTAVKEVYITRDRLELGHLVGKGQFGRVYMGILKDQKGKLTERVAIKTLKYKAEETDMVELFLKEAVLMKEFAHIHVLGLIGIAFDTDTSPMVVLPYMANGDLRQYILNPELDITVLQLLRMGLQVARGMVYLTEKRFVHRDLAARNCMVSETCVVKVADFGLSRELFKRDYYRIEDGKTPLPIRWMAPECIQSSVFTTQSDVWAYGVLLWELITRGAVPYPEVDNWDITQRVLTGHRLGQPVFCPDSVFEIMRRCWQDDPGKRPQFETLIYDIERVIGAARPGSTSSYRLYMNVGASTVNSDYRQTTV